MKHQRQLEETPLRLRELATIRGVSDEYSHLGHDYILSHLTSNTGYFYSDKVRRFDGHTMIICVKGTMRVTIDLDTVEVPPMSLIFVAPERVFKPISWEGESLDAYVLFLSNKFVYALNIDLNAINTNIFTSAKSVLHLEQDRMDLIIRYFELLHGSASAKGHYTRLITRSLFSAAAYQIMAFSEESINSDDASSPPSHNRKLAYVKTFLRLVRMNHRSERAIGFYADKMFISPKYLSLVIKEATGRSAAEWIDQYVIQEAKNLLRYSGKNVQQIAYELNFTTQSSFGKYFKNLTGLSPTQFQNQ